MKYATKGHFTRKLLWFETPRLLLDENPSSFFDTHRRPENKNPSPKGHCDFCIYHFSGKKTFVLKDVPRETEKCINLGKWQWPQINHSNSQLQIGESSIQFGHWTVFGNPESAPVENYIIWQKRSEQPRRKFSNCCASTLNQSNITGLKTNIHPENWWLEDDIFF